MASRKMVSNFKSEIKLRSIIENIKLFPSIIHVLYTIAE